MIIKTIHLMNFANADTLRPNRGRCVRSETARVWALFVLVQHIQESKETRSETIPA